MNNGVLIFAIIGSVLVVAIIAWAVVATAHAVTREKTRRDLMAYVAEGTISPQEAARLIELSEQSELRKKLLAAAVWDWDSDSYHKSLEKVFDTKPATDPSQAKKGEAPAPA